MHAGLDVSGPVPPEPPHFPAYLHALDFTSGEMQTPEWGILPNADQATWLDQAGLDSVLSADLTLGHLAGQHEQQQHQQHLTAAGTLLPQRGVLHQALLPDPWAVPMLPPKPKTE